MLHRSTLVASLALIASLLAAGGGCTPEREVETASNADAAVTQPASNSPTPATAPTPPANQEPAVQPQQPAQPSPNANEPRRTQKDAALDVELFAYQALGLAEGAEEGADQAAAQAIVVLVARGKHRSGGWTSELVQLPIRIFPPQFELRTTPPPPDSMNVQMISPFVATAWVRMDQPVETLKVRVGGQLVDVKVEPAKRVKDAMPGGR